MVARSKTSLRSTASARWRLWLTLAVMPCVCVVFVIADDEAAPPKPAPAVRKAEAKQAEVKEAEAEAKPAKKPAKKAAKKAAAKAEAQEPLFETPAGEPDDLKKISGVGPALEKKLHGLGVTTYAQVAAFTAEDIAKVDDALSFKGRIERDDWVGQAKKLADGK